MQLTQEVIRTNPSEPLALLPTGFSEDVSKSSVDSGPAWSDEPLRPRRMSIGEFRAKLYQESRSSGPSL